jgi:ABC-type phosphate/phosphonate transport system substrate-binding protein
MKNLNFSLDGLAIKPESEEDFIPFMENLKDYLDRNTNPNVLTHLVEQYNGFVEEYNNNAGSKLLMPLGIEKMQAPKRKTAIKGTK